MILIIFRKGSYEEARDYYVGVTKTKKEALRVGRKICNSLNKQFDNYKSSEPVLDEYGNEVVPRLKMPWIDQDDYPPSVDSEYSLHYVRVPVILSKTEKRSFEDRN